MFSIIAGLLLTQTSNLVGMAEVRYELPKNLLKAVALVESNNDPAAFVKSDGRTKRSSYGLFQIQMDTAKFIQKEMIREKVKTLHPEILTKKITVKMLMNTSINVELAAYYLSWLLQKHNGNVAQSLMAYNTGPYSELCKRKVYGQYVGKVLNAWVRLNEN